ncbi:unnamed protein product [Echinostoma caproni]|uniref:G protein-coupled receptor n=1 Tax=Echinostoma caproni TaxID=27848 RepID=A0A183AV92_9TREM|nr:unnamed protein product [Echinostoma caproni]
MIHHVVRVVGFLVSISGILINVVSIIVLSKSMARSVDPGRKVLSIIVLQCILDVLGCFAYMLNMSEFDTSPNWFIDEVIRTRVAFWFFVHCRAYLNAYNSMWQLTRMIYPFWSTPLSSPWGCTALGLFVIGLNILQCFAFTRFRWFYSSDSTTLRLLEERAHGHLAGLYGLSMIVSTVFRYAYPLMIMCCAFNYMLDVLRSPSEPACHTLRSELHKTAFLDGILYGILLLPHEAWFYLFVFANPYELINPGMAGDVVSMIACSYMTVCPLMSLILRQANYNPLMEAVIPPVNYEILGKLIPKWKIARIHHAE